MPNVAIVAPVAETAETETTSSVPDRKIALRAGEAADSSAQPVATSDPPLFQVIPAASPTPATSDTSAVTANPAAHASQADPAAQVAPVLVTLATTTSGNHQMTVRLNPDGLGTVQVRIERTASGETQIAVTADKAATLQALQRDQPQLSRALDQAGIPAAGRSMTFHIMEPAQASSSSNETGSGSSHQAPGGRTSADNAGSDGSSGADPGGGGRGSHSTRESNAYSTGRQSNETTGTNAAAAARTYRAGLDITA